MPGSMNVKDQDVYIRVKPTTERNILMRLRTAPVGIGALVIAVLFAVGAPSVATAAVSDTKPPSTPTNLSVEHVGFTDVTLAWDSSADDSGWLLYEVEVRGSLHMQRLAALDPTKTFTGLPQGTTFRASVVAVDGAGNRSAQSSIQFTTPTDTTTPPAPTRLRPILSNGIVTAVTWDPITDNSPITYRVLADGNGVFSTTGTRVELVDLLFALGYIQPGSTHTLTVDALEATNHVSPPSNAITVTFPS
jgi:Fibronectin type III domain